MLEEINAMDEGYISGALHMFWSVNDSKSGARSRSATK